MSDPSSGVYSDPKTLVGFPKKAGKKQKIYLKKKLAENVTNLKKYQVIQFQEMESPKQDERKETYTEAHYN